MNWQLRAGLQFNSYRQMYPILKVLGIARPYTNLLSLRKELSMSDIGQAYDWLSNYNDYLRRNSEGQATVQERNDLYAVGVELPLVFTRKDVEDVEASISCLESTWVSKFSRIPEMTRKFRNMSVIGAAGIFGFSIMLHSPVMLLVYIALVGLFVTASHALQVSDALTYANALKSMLEPDSESLPPAFESDFWGQQVLNATRMLQTREPWAIEIALWMALFVISGQRLGETE